MWHIINRGKKIWQEDDACKYANDSTRMTIHKKWRELFNEEYNPTKNKLMTADMGDCFYHLMNNGYVVEHSYEGDALFEPGIEYENLI